MSSAIQIKAHMLQQENQSQAAKSTEPKTNLLTNSPGKPGKPKDPKKNLQPKEAVLESEEINGHLIRALDDIGNCICADCNYRGKSS